MNEASYNQLSVIGFSWPYSSASEDQFVPTALQFACGLCKLAEVRGGDLCTMYGTEL